jgi:hypothetical protein
MRRWQWGTAMARAADAGGGEGDAAEYGRSVFSSGEGGTLLAGRRWRRCGSEERQWRVLYMRLVVRGGARVHPGMVSSTWT